MQLLDPRLALVATGLALVGSERVRRTVGRGLGYAASGTMTVAGPVVRPLTDTGRDIVDEARDVASREGSRKGRASR